MRAFFVVLLCILFFSCSSERDDSLDIAIALEPPTLDVQVNSSVSGRMIAVGNIYEKLVTLSEGKIVPELASSFVLSEDGKHLSFKIRDGITFHDGSALDADDVVASLNRWLSLYAEASNAAKGNIFKKEGDEVYIDSDSSLFSFLFMMASSPQSAVIMPSEVIAESTYLVDKFIGTGPYMVERWYPGERIDLVKFESYIPYSDDKSQGPERLSYFFVSDGTTRRLGLESGLYDAIDCVLSDDIPRLTKNDSITLLEGDENGSIALVLNKKEGPFSSHSNRKALSLIIDRDELMRACYGNYGYFLHSDYMERGSGWSVSDDRDPYNESNAEKGALLFDGEKVRILSSNTSNLDKIAIVLAAELEEVGIEAEVTVLDWASFIERRKDPSLWDISISAYSATTLPQLKAFLSERGAGWLEDEKALSMLSTLSDASTMQEAKTLWEETQRYLWEYIPVIILGHYSTVYAISSDITGVILSDSFYFWDAKR